MKRLLIAGFLLVTSTCNAQDAQPNQTKVKKANPQQEVQLSQVVDEVKKALKIYQDSVGSGQNALPALASAEFDFKTTRSVTENGSINLFIFKIGGSHESDDTSDVTFTYSVPPPPQGGTLQGSKKPKLQLADELAGTIQNAALEVKNAKQLNNLNFTKLAVVIQYGVKWDGSVGANVPIQLVTIGVGGDINKNTVQSVKITFGK